MSAWYASRFAARLRFRSAALEFHRLRHAAAIFRRLQLLQYGHDFPVAPRYSESGQVVAQIPAQSLGSAFLGRPIYPFPRSAGARTLLSWKHERQQSSAEHHSR
jgi:hypothetical protein